MFSLFKKKKEYPEFWMDYEKKFKDKTPETIDENSFVVFDTETTGLDIKNDRILSIGALKVQHKSIEVSDVFERYINQSTFNPETVAIHGIIKNDLNPDTTEEAAVIEFLSYISNSVLVAHHVTFDVAMINKVLYRMGLPKLKNKTLDTMLLYRASRINSNLIDKERNYSLDEVAENLNISVKDRHTSAGDAYITAIAFLKIISRVSKQRNGRLKDLFRLNR
ncbi:PolC-type DNA polymerase III [Galbibacter sp.]|uniref:3'-5' exonuclease n=1 Tax=Galbibacter sp. TaxID=2918471 RepID=UPI003A933A79